MAENRGLSPVSLTVRVWRGGADGRFQEFDVPRHESQTVLDVVTHIQRHLDPTLAYRFACRVGMCGSCAMTVNGSPRWTCRTHVDKVAGSGVLEVAPLANLPVVRDLVADMGEFFDKWAKARGHFKPTRTRADDFAAVRPDDPARREADAGIECIGCGVCYSACDAGCHSCHTLMSCTVLCPKELSPTRSIAGLKRATARLAWEEGE